MKDRDVYTPKHPTPRAVPEFVDEEATGKYEGEELRARRSLRATDVRIGRLEEKHDELVATVTDVRVCVGSMSSKLDTFIDTIRADRDRAKLEHETERVRIGSRAKVIVAIASAIGVALGAIVTALSGCGA